MDKKTSVLRICLHQDRPVERTALTYLNKCERTRTTLVSCAINEFVERYQLDDLTSSELKKFLRNYMDFLNGEGESTTRLQKSLFLIGADGKKDICNKTQNDYSSTVCEIVSSTPSATTLSREIEPQTPKETEERNLSDASREKMNSVLGMFRNQK